jgi:nucleoredoxin
MSAFVELLGEQLKKGKETVSTADALAGKTAVGIYFSAHWCPPCRGFTPKLAESYKGIVADGQAFEIVFVSSDRDEKSFDEYYGEQPWLALPFDQREAKAKLSKKYKVGGIPTFIILDGATGEVITKDGRTSISEDPKGERFPWKPPTIWEALGEEVISNTDGDTIQVSELRKPGKVLGLYFSAHWCPPCRGFTPKLIETYKAVKAAGKDFEVIFVSSDKSQPEFFEYYGTMPWLAIPQGDKRKKLLDGLFEVEGIPTFVTIDGETGATINKDARGSVGADPTGQKFPWHPDPVNNLSSPDGINDSPALCVMVDGCDDAAKKAAWEVLTPIAKASIASGADMLFFVADSSEGAVPQVRKLTSLGEASTKPQLLLMDIPDEGGFYVAPEDTPITSEGVNGFLAKQKAGEITRQQLS